MTIMKLVGLFLVLGAVASAISFSSSGKSSARSREPGAHRRGHFFSGLLWAILVGVFVNYGADAAGWEHPTIIGVAATITVFYLIVLRRRGAFRNRPTKIGNNDVGRPSAIEPVPLIVSQAKPRVDAKEVDRAWRDAEGIVPDGRAKLAADRKATKKLLHRINESLDNPRAHALAADLARIPELVRKTRLLLSDTSVEDRGDIVVALAESLHELGGHARAMLEEMRQDDAAMLFDLHIQVRSSAERRA